MPHAIDHRATFFAQSEALKTFPMFQRMARTVEGSPWHREANVLVHTEMVVGEYVKLVDSRCESYGEPWSRHDYLGAIACAFHDTGKPAAEIEKWSESRGNYRAYHGHELLSARMFETYAALRYPMFTAEEIFQISWIIEHHMPWQIEDATKLNNMAMTVKSFGHGGVAYAHHLLADQYGRIADDQETKNARAREWVEKFMQRVSQVEVPTMQPHPEDGVVPTLWLPIAPSGAGKSTFLKSLVAQGVQVDVFSLDLLRHEFYDPVDYNKAYEGSVKDKSFEARANARFHAMIKACRTSGHDLYVDNTNLSARRRRWYIDIARKHGFKVVAVTMPVSLDVLLARQKTRGDKCVPDHAVRQQYNSLQAPMLGEVDQIIVSDHNLVKP